MTRKTRTTRHDSTTIQLWPSGQSITYRGRPSDPPTRRSIRAKSGKWVRGTEAEWRAIRIAERAEMYQRNYIWCCDSALVYDLLRTSSLLMTSSEGGWDLADAFSMEAIENLYADPSDWDAAQRREYANDQGFSLPDVPTSRCETCDGDGDVTQASTGEPLTLAEPARIPCAICKGTGEIPDHPDHWEDDNSRHGWLTEAREACRDHALDNPTEVYEWYRVDPWLCGKLRDIGEVVIDNEYGCWFGRQTTGQALIMDGVLQRIAAQFEANDRG